MKKRNYGPSLYYATDKNVFDALNQYKVDTLTIMKLFRRRNIIVGKKTPREELAKYFSRLPHDYFDHQNISSRLGIAPRRERITSMDINGVSDDENLQIAIDQIKKEIEKEGDVVQVTREDDKTILNVQYSTVDYKVNEFSQVQVRDGTIEFVKIDTGFTVRNTQNEYLNMVRDTLIERLAKLEDNPITRTVVSLFDVPSPKSRSKFFYDLISNLKGYARRDVTDVYVYKAKPEVDEETSDNNEIGSDPHIERVFLRGNAVMQTELLNDLLNQENYYITKIGWTAACLTGLGDIYEIEAVFADPKDCTGFSFILRGVFPMEDGKVSSRRRAPSKHEIDAISRVIEALSRDLVTTLRNEIK